ncbi:MAG TPA: hypothetical protein VF962_14010 [Gemmatimonadaceae bacterium]
MMRKLVLALVLAVTPAMFAGEGMMGMMVKGPEAQKARSAMDAYIKQHTIGDTFYYYDPVDSKLLSLKFDDLHKDVMQEGKFLMACSDFHDQSGHKYDIDFLAVPNGRSVVVTQPVLHAIDGKERPHHLVLK